MMLWISVTIAVFAGLLLLLYYKVHSVFPLDHSGFRNVSESLETVIVVVHTKRCEILFASPGIQRLFGVSSSEISFDTIIASLEAEDREGFKSMLNSATGNSSTGIFRVRKGKDIFWIYIKGIPAVSFFTHKTVLLFTDITEQKRNELQLAKARDYEVSIGARIQQALLLGLPHYRNPCIETSAMSIPSQKIDGDFYDFFETTSEQLDIILGDVMGKGIPAALTGAAAKNAFLRARMKSADTSNMPGPDLQTILTAAESILAHHLIHIGTFVTLVYGRVDTGRKLFRFIDCGHTSIIHYESSSGRCWRMKGSNMPLGFTETQEYREYLFPLGKNDILFFFSDGISEAENSEGEMFKEERIVKLIQAHSGLPAEELLEQIKQITFQYSAGFFKDDVTGIVAKVSNISDWIDLQEKAFSFELSSLRTIREFITNWLSEIPSEVLTGYEKEKISIAAGEAVSNILKHNSAEERIQCTAVCRRDSSWISLSLHYKGIDFEWYDPKKPDLMNYDTGGYGLGLMKESMDSITVSRGDEGTVKIELTYLLSGPKRRVHGTS